ncbi:TraB/GumN family protein [Sphingomonas solaris]|uniref:TraB/GumN family protein n=1 Tax=Alterirhizorhabdus solaris TaxID=2529389 RepID=A0A558R706_9SPHN|nr:TraB/GumN family protein [Sphingomonas solaris]TVV75161.1 TraB/GumN family protein [Sphingomonas solaris]
MRRFPLLTGPLLAALLLAACAPAPAPPPQAAAVARPAVWKLADADTTIYLFGTIHVLPTGYAWQNGPVRDAVGQAQGLVLETLVGPDPAAVSRTMLAMGRAPGLPPLLDRVPADKRAAIAALIARSGLPLSLLDGMKTWAAALLLVGTTLTDMKLVAGEGVEPQLEAAFRARSLPVEGLETPAEQLGFFDTLPETAQRDFLATLADDGATARKDYDAMLAAWSRGDAKAIAATFDEELKESAALRETLLVRRNARWAKWLEARLARPGTVLVAMGAGHLTGRDSVQDVLKKDGLKVVRLR